MQQFLALSEAKFQCLLHPAQANLGYFLVWFQSLQLPSTQSESPLVPKFYVFQSMHSTVKRSLHISIRISCNRISEGLLYHKNEDMIMSLSERKKYVIA
jgi:hypothetical protein